MKYLVFFLYILLLLNIPVQAETTAPHSRHGCEFHELANLHLRNEGGYLLVPITIHGYPINMVVDTGSEGSLISAHIVKQLHLPVDQLQKTVMNGPRGGQRLVKNVIIDKMKLDRLTIGPLTIPVGDLPSYPNVIPAVGGLIGGDILSEFDLEFNLWENNLKLWQVNTNSMLCRAPPFWDKEKQVIDIKPYGHRVIVMAEVNKTPIRALFDSGARSCILSLDSALRIGITLDDLKRSPGGISSGVDMQETIYHWHRFKSFRLGNEIQLMPTLTVAPLHDTVDMLIGSDWFSNHHVWISYQRGKIYFQKNNLKTKIIKR